MGHCIQYLSFDYGTKKQKIMDDIYEWARCNCDRQENPDGSYHGNFKFDEFKEFKTREEAEKYLDGLDAYVDRGVIYYEYPKVEPKSAMKKLKESADKIKELGLKYANEHSVQIQKADYIGCKHCGSKISKKHISDRINLDKMAELTKDWDTKKYEFRHYHQQCPVCKGDLRADYIQEKLNEYADKINDIDKKYEVLEKAQNDKNFKKAKKKWLCKVEVHC